MYSWRPRSYFFVLSKKCSSFFFEKVMLFKVQSKADRAVVPPFCTPAIMNEGRQLRVSLTAFLQHVTYSRMELDQIFLHVLLQIAEEILREGFSLGC